MWECVVNAWAWLESNSGQVQTFIGIIALGFAVQAYFKVLKQIKISDRQTDLTIQQMTKYNEERVFELRMRLKIRIGEHSKSLMELQDACNDLCFRLQELLIDTQKNHEESFDTIEVMVKPFRDNINSARAIVSQKLQENSSYLNESTTTSDISFMEDVLDKIEQNQLIYQDELRKIKSDDTQITKIWMPMNMGIYEAIRRKNNLS